MTLRRASIFLALVLAGCGATVEQSAAPGSPALTSPGPAPGSASASAIAGGPAEVRAGALEPGEYTRAAFEPRVTFELDDGWQGVQLLDGFFDVQQDPGSPDVIAVQFANVDGVYGANGRDVPATSAELAARTVTENDAIEVLGESPSLIAGLDGFTVEIENTGTADVGVLRVPPGPLGLSPERRLWISFFDTPDGVLAILVGGSVAMWREALDAAEPVLESIRISE